MIKILPQSYPIKTKIIKSCIFVYLLLMVISLNNLYAQAEFTTWGNMTGIRVDGQLMEFRTSMVAVAKNWKDQRRTRKEAQRIGFNRKGNQKIFTFQFDRLTFKKTIETIEEGVASVDVQFTAQKDTTLAGAFLRVDLPHKFYKEATAKVKGAASVELQGKNPAGNHVFMRTPAKGIQFAAPGRQLEITFEDTTDIIVKRNAEKDYTEVYLELMAGQMEKGVTAGNHFRIEASGKIDQRPVSLKIYPDQTGRPFNGIGGNFRLQNSETDPKVIDYCLNNMRVAEGRVEMPWDAWHPTDTINPLQQARKGNIDPEVENAMEMAQRLDEMGMPVHGAIWFPPDWAIVDPPARGDDRLDTAKMDAIYESITSYILYLKEEYGVELANFSFNESDIGIDVLQTAQEHRALIKGLGDYFASRGLDTKFLLGDTGDVRGWPFTEPASKDPEAQPHIGAASFHSWRGYTEENLYRWRDIANRVDKPLIIGEGSIDAGAWRYPQIFQEPIYAMEEIDIYVKILKIAQPRSILQWQLTADYSPLAGGGIFGNDEDPLHPTQRFFNLKQLASTPKGLYAMPIRSNREDITCAALGDNEKGTYAIHLVNKGPEREATITGLPDDVRRLQVYVTDRQKEMEKGKRVRVRNGEATFTLEAASFTSLIGG